jgi:polar amino acid transport system substrate-binding protein
MDESIRIFVDQGLHALSGLRPRLLSDQARLPGSVLLPGSFMAVQQAVGTSKRHQAAPVYLADFVERAKAQGRVQAAIDAHHVPGVNVASARR